MLGEDLRVRVFEKGGLEPDTAFLIPANLRNQHPDRAEFRARARAVNVGLRVSHLAGAQVDLQAAHDSHQAFSTLQVAPSEMLMQASVVSAQRHSHATSAPVGPRRQGGRLM